MSVTEISDKNYFKEYWKRNRETLLEKRRKRYKEDPAYRNSIRKTSIIWQKIKTLSKKGVCPIVDFNGQKEQTYSLVAMSKLISRGYGSLTNLTNSGCIPPPLFYRKRIGLYVESQKNLIEYLIGINGILTPNDRRSLSCKDLANILKIFWGKTFNKKEVRNYVKDYNITKKKESKALRCSN